MARFLLDTDTVSYALRGDGAVSDRILRHAPSEICISAITLAELRFGAERKKSPTLRRAIRRFIDAVTVLPFDAAAAERFGLVGAELAAAGTPIGAFDTLIAAHALTQGLIVVTNNTRHFGLVPGLKTENWT